MFPRACLGLLLLLSIYVWSQADTNGTEAATNPGYDDTNAYTAAGKRRSLLDCIRFRNAVEHLARRSDDSALHTLTTSWEAIIL